MDRQEYYELMATHFKGEARLLGCKASVHLEDKDDERFWDTLMQNYCPGKFNYIYSSRNARGVETSGCIHCLQFRDYLSKDFFICMDSDYRLLRQEPKLDIDHYICQTYTYSWENHYCQADRLQSRLEECDNGLAQQFSFVTFLQQYSEVIFEPMILLLYLERTGRLGMFTQKTLKGLVSTQYRTGDLDNNGATVIARLKTALDNATAPIKVASQFNFAAEMAYYNSLGLYVDNAYLHFRGHNLYNLVLSLGKNLCNGRLDFEQEVLLHGLAFDAYPEIISCQDDLEKLQSMFGSN